MYGAHRGWASRSRFGCPASRRPRRRQRKEHRRSRSDAARQCWWSMPIARDCSEMRRCWRRLAMSRSIHTRHRCAGRVPRDTGALRRNGGGSSRVGTSSLDLAAAMHAAIPWLPIVLATTSADGIGTDALLVVGIFEVVRRPLISTEIAAALRRGLALPKTRSAPELQRGPSILRCVSLRYSKTRAQFFIIHSSDGRHGICSLSSWPPGSVPCVRWL